MIKFLINIFFIFFEKINDSSFFKMNKRFVNFYYFFNFFNKNNIIDKTLLESLFFNKIEFNKNNEAVFCFNVNEKYDNYILNCNKKQIKLFIHLYISEYRVWGVDFYVINLRSFSSEEKDIYYLVRKQNLNNFSKFFISDYFYPVDIKKEVFRKINSF